MFQLFLFIPSKSVGSKHMHYHTHTRAWALIQSNVQPDWILYIIHHRTERWNTLGETMKEREREHLRPILPCYAAPVSRSINTRYLSGHLMLPQHSTIKAWLKPAILHTTSKAQQPLQRSRYNLTPHRSDMYGCSKYDPNSFSSRSNDLCSINIGFQTVTLLLLSREHRSIIPIYMIWFHLNERKK